MPKWTPDDHGCIYDEAGCFARLTPNKAERLASRHNADIDALTAERDRLAAENAELKSTDHYQRSLDEMHLRYNVEADLTAAGCLVPVPDGEPCEIRNLESDFFIQGQTVYRVPSGEFYGLPLGYEGSHYAAFYGTHDTIVQPVRLVKLEDVG